MREIAKKFGGVSQMAHAMGISPNTARMMVYRGINDDRPKNLYLAALRAGIPLTIEEIIGITPEEISAAKKSQ